MKLINAFQRKVMFMKLKGSWVRILGLLVVISFLAACGNTGAGTTGASGAASTAASTVGASTSDSSTAASTESSASAASSMAASTEASSAASSAASTAGAGATIKVGSKNFTEEFIIAEMYAQLLEANGFKVERKLNLGATDIAHQALLKGDIDLYPEYTSTALLTVLKLPKQDDPQQILATVKSEYEKRFKLTWLQPSPFNDTNALAMTKKRADELGIKTYSDLFNKADQVILGGPAEFFESEQGLKPLQALYGGKQFKETKQLDPGLRYPALTGGQIDAVVAFSTDGQLGSPDLVVLQDDKKFYPIYQVAPVVRQDTLQKNPQIADILNKLALPALNEKTMAQLNNMVDGPEKMEPAAVAKKFLTDQGLLK